MRAYEDGLQAMREGLRRVARRETQLTTQLKAREDEVADLLGVITTIETSTPPVLMLHPSGPLGAARSAMMLAEVTPGLQARADALALWNKVEGAATKLLGERPGAAVMVVKR